ncbi:predicted protein [Streptomyces filamentosus NRRL 15998]|uniref:Predicted protein n=1 Tax=Streptomyces filamentosus NRRL 15998 TaxID=457431 RepID=D6AFB9_STRFL|nr:predicted protein [Streptomyces filamentosus NRRL 15998]
MGTPTAAAPHVIVPGVEQRGTVLQLSTRTDGIDPYGWAG